MESEMDLIRPAVTAQPANALSKLWESDSESERAAPLERARPMTLISRLQPQLDNETSESDDGEDDDNAYERVRKMLMSTPNDSQSKEKPDFSPKKIAHLSSDDEEHMPAPRQRVSRRAERSSPVSSPVHTRSRTPSPGLFVTPDASPALDRSSGSSPTTEKDRNENLQERVRRIRAERLAKRNLEEQQAKRTERIRRHEQSGAGSDSDENGRRLTQSSRPARRAGKKALEEMAREQQRISRNMQLSHQAKTKKKYGAKDLLARFGLAQMDSELVPMPVMPTPDASSAMASSDGEHHETPPSSPPIHDTLPQSQSPTTSALPTAPKLDKGKGRAQEFEHLPPNPVTELYKQLGQKASVDTEMVELSDSEEEQITAKPRSRFPVFDRLPQAKAQGQSSLLLLRHLAHLTSPGKTGPKHRKTMNMAELQFSLAQKARAQAQKEREEKIEELKRRGIHIETEEERERNQLEIEDLVAQFEKAREEDMKLTKLERAEAKKNGETDDLPSSDESEDEDFVASGDERPGSDQDGEDENEGMELELSGSEDDVEGEEEEGEEEEEEMEPPNHLLDNAAEESQDESEERLPSGNPEEAETDDDDPQPHIRKQTGARARKVVIDEDDEDEPSLRSNSTQATPLPSQTQKDDPMAAFGFDKSSPGLGLTQMFAGTMANFDSNTSQTHPLDTEPEQDSLDFFKSLPDTQPNGAFTEPCNLVVPNSQAPASPNGTQISLGINHLMQTPQTQQIEDFEPTQDAGFELPRVPPRDDQPVSTVDTVMISVSESPVSKRKGRLQRGRRATTTELSEVEEDADISGAEDDDEDADEPAASDDAFAILAKTARRQKRLAETFNKKTSWAKEAVQEQAEESEDEYAGLGGASDEDSGEDDEELAEMIDTNDVKVDERRLAAFYADKAKKDDEKNINQLYKDIMNGGLRKRRGGDAFDVSDPEDEIEQRRRKKQREFQQMTKALISDEKIGKIAQNPKQSAFFQTLADHMEDPEYDFLNAGDMEVTMDDSQSPVEEAMEGENGTEVAVPDSQTMDGVAAINPLKRKSPDSQEKENRPPPHLRRTVLPDGFSRKPMTIADVQHSVAELLDDPRVMVPDSQFADSDSELEIEPSVPAAQKQVVDRLTMARASLAAESTADGHLAFQAPTAGAHLPGFRMPSLVRRATSNLSAVSTSSSGTTTPVEETVVRRGGTGRSNIHAQAREAERRAALEKVEQKRKETLKKKVGKAQGKRSILRVLDGGFE